jgi:hypothetical protein
VKELHMNNDSWLYSLRTEPSPHFKERLRARLRGGEPVRETRREWPRRALMAVAAMALFAAVLTVPGVRTAVAQFVSLFRVVNFVAVPVDASRIQRLKAEQLDLGALIGEHVQVVRDPGPPAPVASLEGAAALAGMTVMVPQYLPDKSKIFETTVAGEREVRVTASGRRLQQVMDALGINDLTVPAGLEGQVVDVRVPPVVTIRYEHGPRRSRFIQARVPHVALPAGIDVRALGEIGLRILGLGPAEARQFAQAIDWHSTLVVPVPPNASSFRQVKIGGHSGVMIQHQPRNGSLTHMALWSTPERVFVLMSTEPWNQVLAMADSVR